LQIFLASEPDRADLRCGSPAADPLEPIVTDQPLTAGDILPIAGGGLDASLLLIAQSADRNAMPHCKVLLADGKCAPNYLHMPRAVHSAKIGRTERPIIAVGPCGSLHLLEADTASTAAIS